MGDAITVTATVTAYRPDKHILTLGHRRHEQAGEKVFDGEAVVLVADVKDASAPPAAATAAYDQIPYRCKMQLSG